LNITELGLGISGISWTPKDDNRGTLIRIFDSQVLEHIGQLDQISLVRNPTKGTLRGLHFQLPPNAESKLISCIRGSLFDVMVQIDPVSSNFGKMICVEISAREGINALIIPKGFAHGYLTLEEDTELIYSMDSPFVESQSRGLHWKNNPLNIPWPREVSTISQRDSANPNWDEYFQGL